MHRSTVLLATLLAALALPSAAAAKRPRVAVMDLRSLGIDASTAELLSEMALTEATSIEGVEAIGRSEINAVLGFEKQKQMFGCAEDGSCLAEIAGALGVDYVLIGSVGKIGQLYRIDMKVLEAKKARARDRIGETQSDQEKLLAAVQRGIRRLLSPLAVLDAPAAAKVATPVAAAPAAGGGSIVPPSPSDPTAPSSPTRTKWAYAVGGLGVVLTGVGEIATIQARKQTKSLMDVQFSTAAPTCPYFCPEADIANARDSFSRTMRSADIARWTGWTAVGSALWLGLGAQPAPGEPRRFLQLDQRSWGYVLGGAGLAIGGVGLYYDSRAKKANDAAEWEALYDPGAVPIKYSNYWNSVARTAAAGQYRGLRNRYLVTSGALLAGGVTLWLTGGTRAPPVAIDVVPTAGGAMASLSASW